MKTQAKLLVIDAQNDFIDKHKSVGGSISDAIDGISTGYSFKPALPVTGSYDDMQRLTSFIAKKGKIFSEVVLTLDAHQSVAIERPSFWKGVAPFTVITHKSYMAGKFELRNPEMSAYVENYLKTLESSKNKFELMVWPAHCVIGTEGFNIQSDIQTAVLNWEQSNSCNKVTRVLKGMNPITEQYSAIRAEVPVKSDKSTMINADLVESLSNTVLYVAGEASSHCVKHTMLDLYELLPTSSLANIYLLEDCMSPVTGFELSEKEFFEYSKSIGVNVVKSTDI